MALIARISRLFHADMNAVLDKIEEPELLLKQAIREMEETLAQDDRQIRLWDYEQRQFVGKQDELTKTLSDLEDKLALCFQAKKDDLAWPLIKRKLEAQQTLKTLSVKNSVLQEKITRLTAQLTEHQAQLAGMKQKAEVFLDENRINPADWDNPLVSVRDEDVEVAFLCEKQKWSQS